MNTTIEKRLSTLYSDIMSKPNQILEVFNDFFGEDKVDMQQFPNFEEFTSWIMEGISLRTIISSDSKIFNEDFNYNTYKTASLSEISEDKCIEILDYIDSTSIINTIINRGVFKNGFILVYFPHVRVTNEHDRFVDINHLYAKVRILMNGTICGTFSLNRAEYSYLHISSNYMHSHVGSIPFDDFTQFRVPCTGSGPIVSTMTNLNKEFDIDIWKLFCVELSKYVEVESIVGVPYHRLESLGIDSNFMSLTEFIPYIKLSITFSAYHSLILDFTRYFINQRKLKLNYINGSYSIGMTMIEYIVTISNEFIDWYNDQFNKGIYTYNLNYLINNNILKYCIIANDRIYIEHSGNNTIERYRNYIGQKICRFKNRDILLNITDICKDTNKNKSLILNSQIAFFILTKIFYIVNYKYGKSEQTDSEGNRISEKVRYF